MTDITHEQQKANRKLWVAELRSGRIKQTTRMLEAPDGSMCCLGVLSKLAGARRAAGSHCITYEDSTMSAGPTALAWVGLASRSGTFFEDGVEYNLADRNDGGTSFTEIANIIESEPDGLFTS